MPKRYKINFTDGTYISIIGYDEYVEPDFYGFKNASMVYQDFEGNLHKNWTEKKTDLDGHVWKLGSSRLDIGSYTYITYPQYSASNYNGAIFFVLNAKENKLSFSFYTDIFLNGVDYENRQYIDRVNYAIKEGYVWNFANFLIDTYSIEMYPIKGYFTGYGGTIANWDDFKSEFKKSLESEILNTDPYADGGASDTGGGGGSFDGTTEIINEPDTPLVNVTATKFVSLYNPTESQLNNLAYFMWHTLDPTTWIKIVADPMDAIISLSVLPIAIPSSSASDISVGGISTGVSCNLASAQYISFDAGTITVPQYSNSYLDYAPYTTISIYLPYVGLRKIPTDLVMGKVLGVKYRIDIFTGACCVYITVGGSVILQFTGNCAQQIPFTSSNWTQAITTMISMIGSGVMAVANPATAALSVAGMANSAVNGMHADIETGGANGGNVGFLGVQKPYIIIQRPKQCIPANQNTFTGYPSYITATLGDLKGYTEVDKIILENINATENELNELESLLKGGVYVNEL